jgi:hypothetical protein
MTAAEIDRDVAILLDGLKVILRAGAKVYPPLEMAVLAEPIIAFVIKHQAAKLKAGLADGSIISDGHGGFVPATNSRYDPNTGFFVD